MEFNNILRTDIISGLDKNSCKFLHDFIIKNNCYKILEIGMANGLSSLSILTALKKISDCYARQ